MTILIGCDSFLSLRNIRNSHLAQHLHDTRIVALVDPNQYDGSLRAAPAGVTIDRLLDFDAHRESELAPRLLRAYMARKCYYDPITMWQNLKASSASRHTRLRLFASLTRARWTMGRYWLAGRLGYAQQWRQDFIRALRAHPITEAYQRLFDQYQPDLVVAFSLEGPREMALLEAARRAGLRTAVMIRSRDNLAAKIQHIPDAEAYLVWSQVMGDFLLRLYPEFDPGKVHVTGSPQFDRHLDPAYRLTREDFFRQIGLDSGRPLVVYTCATPGLISHEINITQHLADAARDGKLARNAQLLVRGHPRGFGSDYKLLHTVHPGTAVFPPPTSIPYRSPEHEAQVVRLILEDELMHLATLAYQDVQVNVSGTMIVDSAILDKPTVCVYYDIPSETPAGLSVRRFYSRTDMRYLLDSAGFRLAHSPDDALYLINQYLENPALDAPGRQRIREMDCGPLDGQAGQRIAHLLKSVLA